MPFSEKRSSEHEVLEMPDAEDQDLEKAQEFRMDQAGKAEIGMAGGGSGTVSEASEQSRVEIAKIDKEAQIHDMKQAAVEKALAKIEAGMDPQDLLDLMLGEEEALEDELEGYEDQPALREAAKEKLDIKDAQISAIQEYIKKAA